ncbi:MAG TPA: sensor histidine kinase [Chryseosolibacter sp.]|nr:sensor histidine kinase [Chryseosolibacter sp.]
MSVPPHGQLTVSVAIVFLLACSSFAQSPYILRDSDVVHRMDKHVEVYLDPTGAATFEDVAAPVFQRFEPSKGNLTFGYIKSVIWLKVTTKVSTPKTEWHLEIPAPFLEYVDFYQLRDSSWHHSQAGYYRPHHIREISHTGHVISLHFGADSVSRVFVRIAGSSPKTFPLLIMEKDRFIGKLRYEDIGYGIFFGILAVMFFFNFFIYATLRLTNYLLYICTIVCTFLIFAAASGYAGKFLWPQSPDFNFYAGRLTLGILTIFLAIFTMRFLEVRKYSRVMYYMLASLVVLGVVAFILVATGAMSSAGNNLVAVSTIIYMTTGIVCRAEGNKTANYFIAAWTVYLIGGLLLSLRNSGVLDFNFWTTHLVEIGAALETIIIALALGDRYRRYKLEKEEAQALALRVQREATEELEMKVKERTEELTNAYEELNETLKKNKLQTKVIEDKNAELDAFFYRISHDLKGPISSLLALASLAKIDIRDPLAQTYFERQYRQVERMNDIVTGLIKLTRLTSGNLPRQKIDFDKLVDECILSFNGAANFPNITFRKNIQPGLEFHSEWVLQNAILQNLIENAIKYARDESPFVDILVAEQAGGVMIEVADNGQGIDPELQPRIFEMFFRGTDGSDGSGLGLYILKRSVDRLNGTIEVTSTPGIGSRFTVRLPALLEASLFFKPADVPRRDGTGELDSGGGILDYSPHSKGISP